jgi:hypothetical protein
MDIEQTYLQDTNQYLELLTQEQAPKPLQSPSLLHDFDVALHTINQFVTSVPQIKFSLNEEDISSNMKKQTNKIKINPANSIKKKQNSKKKKITTYQHIPFRPRRATGLDKPLILSPSLSAVLDGDTEVIFFCLHQVFPSVLFFLLNSSFRDPKL